MELNKENIKRILFILCAAIAFCIALINLSSVWAALGNIVSFFTPIILGFCIAFVLDPLTSFFEKKLFGGLGRRFGPKGKGAARALGIVLAIIIVSGFFALLGLLVVPEVRDAFTIIGQTIPKAITDAALTINGWLARLDVEFRIPIGGTADWMTSFAKLRQYVANWLDEGYLSNLADTALSVVSGFTNFLLGLITSIYILSQKDQILRFFGRLTRACFKRGTTNRIFRIFGLCNSSFRNFVTGQFTEAVIIALLCFIGMVIFRFPYPMAASAVVGVSALIPVFGAWIGGILGALLALSDSVSKALLFVVFLVVLQQLEGNLIYPRVVGKSVGLPGILVFVAVTLGAGVSGVVGMLLAVPVCSILYTLVKEFIGRRLVVKTGEADMAAKDASEEEPPETDTQ